MRVIITDEVKAQLIHLVQSIKNKEYWTEDTNDDGEIYEYIELTVGYDDESWDFQTGDNSYFGGAYYYSAPWLVTQIYPDSDPTDVVAELLSQV
jgi:hypothetical protein